MKTEIVEKDGITTRTNQLAGGGMDVPLSSAQQRSWVVSLVDFNLALISYGGYLF